VINVRLALPPGQSYSAGDVLVVWPRADPELVRRFVVETLDLSLQKRVRIVLAKDGVGGSNAPSPFPDMPLSMEEIFSAYLDISAVPTRHFFHVLSLHTDHELHKQKLTEFASRTVEAKDALYEYCKSERRSAAEVMWDFWTARPPLAELLGALPLMRPRRYSIASCPGWYCPSRAPQDAARCWLSRPLAVTASHVPITSGCHNGPVESVLTEQLANYCDGQIGRALDLCVGIVKFKTKTGREGHGLCSEFLRRTKEGATLHCSLEGGSLSLPPLEVPLIMICPGTGLSPCRALVQERHVSILHRNGHVAAERSRFANGINDLLFLGFRHQNGDFLYGDEWHTFEAWLQVHIAFSRDHEDCKVYVQDIIEKHGEQVCKLLDAGARVYVCGRSHPMPSQVFDALSEVLQVHRGLAAKEAAAKLREMQRIQHYVCDTWG